MCGLKLFSLDYLLDRIIYLRFILNLTQSSYSNPAAVAAALIHLFSISRENESELCPEHYTDTWVKTSMLM